MGGPGRDDPDALHVEIADLAALRAWLERNYTRPDGAWLVTWKKRPGAPYVAYEDVVDELLCFGWIDNLARRLDDARSRLWVAPRRPGSGWSKVNKTKIARLREAGRMHPAGEAAIAGAIADGSWTKLDEVETLAVPDDLAAALGAVPGARAYFDRFPPSSRRAILEWVSTAKRAETRAARVREVAEKAGQNRKANFPAGRDAGPR